MMKILQNKQIVTCLMVPISLFLPMFKNLKTKKFQLDKNVRNNFFLTMTILFLPFTPLYFQIYKKL